MAWIPSPKPLKTDPAKTWADEISEWRRNIAEMRGKETDLHLRIAELDFEKSMLELKVAALIRVLVESGTVDAALLGEMMKEIDAADGTVDGRVTPAGPGRPPLSPHRRRESGDS